MATVHFKGNTVHTIGALPQKGRPAPDFRLTDTGLQDRSLDDFRGHRLVLNIFPSLDTPVCAASVRRFNQLAASLEGVKVLAVSRDLPFAHARFCTTEGIEHVINLSDYKTCRFGKDYGVELIDGPLERLFARAVIVIEADGTVGYKQLMSEITEEPDYDAVMAYLKG